MYKNISRVVNSWKSVGQSSLLPPPSTTAPTPVITPLAPGRAHALNNYTYTHNWVSPVQKRKTDKLQIWIVWAQNICIFFKLLSSISSTTYLAIKQNMLPASKPKSTTPGQVKVFICVVAGLVDLLLLLAVHRLFDDLVNHLGLRQRKCQPIPWSKPQECGVPYTAPYIAHIQNCQNAYDWSLEHCAALIPLRPNCIWTLAHGYTSIRTKCAHVKHWTSVQCTLCIAQPFIKGDLKHCKGDRGVERCQALYTIHQRR